MLKITYFILFALSLIGCVDNKNIRASVNYLRQNFRPKSVFIPVPDNLEREEITIEALPKDNYIPNLETNGYMISDFRGDKNKIIDTIINTLKKDVGNEKAFSPEQVRESIKPHINSLENYIKEWGKKNLSMAFHDVVCGQGVYRNTKLMSDANKPYEFVHIDFAKDQDLTQLFKKSGLRKELKRKYKDQLSEEDFWQKNKVVEMLNFWLPLKKVQAFPLAILDKSTVEEEDIIIYEARPLGFPGGFLGQGLKYNPKHKFYYQPNLDKGQVLIFQSFYAPHTAFMLPKQEGDRESLDIRCVFINTRKS